MQTLNANQNFRSKDPVWILLAELSLRDFLSDHDRRDGPTAGLLFQTARELGMSPECMENIARSLAGFAKEALVRTKHGGLEFPGWIRIFCQKKIMDDEKSAKTSRPPKQDKQQNQVFPDSGGGGWGYFIIERGEDLPPYSSAIPQSYIDLYLYKEGK
jgi:hypothetical protein